MNYYDFYPESYNFLSDMFYRMAKEYGWEAGEDCFLHIEPDKKEVIVHISCYGDPFKFSIEEAEEVLEALSIAIEEAKKHQIKEKPQEEYFSGKESEKSDFSDEILNI